MAHNFRLQTLKMYSTHKRNPEKREREEEKNAIRMYNMKVKITLFENELWILSHFRWILATFFRLFLGFSRLFAPLPFPPLASNQMTHFFT